MNHKANPITLTLNEALQRASIFLEQNGQDGSLARHYWLLVHDWDLTALVLNLHQQITLEQSLLYQSALNRIVQDEPIQYITGFADFMGEKFKVTRETLIPREDTAGLVDLTYQYLNQHSTAKVLDIGTGTGIIPIMLAKRFPTVDIWACDISLGALEIAKENMLRHEVKVNLIKSDLFEMFEADGSFDVIISNPPYISFDELDVMDESVKKYEPQQALFAAEHGLAIYQQIADQASGYIQSNGVILLEIGYRQATAVTALFQEKFINAQISVKQDLNGHDRYVIIQL